MRLRWLRTSQPLIEPATNLVQTYFKYIRAINLWMQISRMVLVYDVKISQRGRKNLAVRFDLDQARGFPIIARKSGGRVRLYSRPGNDFTRPFR